MKKISILGASLLAALMSVTSCSDDFSAGDNAWDKEQYAHYISFKAPLGDNGVTELYVPYTRKNIDRTPMYPEEGRNGKGISEYYLPVIVSGSTTNKQNITVHVGADPDTLASVNESRFQLRTDLYYKDMSQYASYPETVNVPSGQDVSLMHIKFDFTDIDLVNKCQSRFLTTPATVTPRIRVRTMPRPCSVYFRSTTGRATIQEQV